MRTRVPWHPRRQRRKEKEKKRSKKGKKEKREKKAKREKKRKREKVPVERCADTYAPEPRYWLPASCIPYVPKAQGSWCATVRTP